MNIYEITYLNEEKREGDCGCDRNNFSWDAIKPLKVDCFPWDNAGYKPLTEVRLCYTENELRVHFTSYETEIRAVHTNVNDAVHKDSCVEMFFIPKPEEDRRYFNIEINAIGTVYTKIGKERKDREVLPNPNWPEMLNVKASVKKDEADTYSKDKWTIEYIITPEFIRQAVPSFDGFKSGMVMEANFYKCGDETKEEHYACWNPINNPAPDFHRPEFFGKLIFK